MIDPNETIAKSFGIANELSSDQASNFVSVSTFVMRMMEYGSVVDELINVDDVERIDNEALGDVASEAIPQVIQMLLLMRECLYIIENIEQTGYTIPGDDGEDE